MKNTQALAAVVSSVGLLVFQADAAFAQQKPSPAAQGPLPPHATEVEEDALKALRRMGAYLDTLKTFGLTANTSLEVVTVDGQRLQLDGVTTYKVRRPNGFVINMKSDIKNRTFVYDGKHFTVYAPELKYYATVDAPPTNIATLDKIYDNFGISLPLEDLFHWNNGETREAKLISGFVVGPATIDGVATDHYAFREKGMDWQIWIAKGDRPLPKKLVIIDRTDESAPTYIARLSWVENPRLTQQDFAFSPGSDAKPIKFTAAR
ncbi:MAG: DUF2092 domain-containing protein [Phenylobacterium sp.]|uniref:DUF2092 domain-containing protein n=1 Tax=Phenylobacterium sp. TaxID=1871053 RepID=UPI002721C2ED|nr:DUF2092 domain-containing protein [Phenylobacterium sp.]MDO9433640.1 DUF2092 domain-containing protein [Phenylobacterium sp.]